MIKAIPTDYKGITFRSKREAKWALFLDECNADWVYEPMGYEFGEDDDVFTMRYLPDFYVKNIPGYINGDLFMEVKGELSFKDAMKINNFIKALKTSKDKYTTKSVFMLGEVPLCRNVKELIDKTYEQAFKYDEGWPQFFNLKTVDGNEIVAYPGINMEGKFEIFADIMESLNRMNVDATLKAYRSAINAKFDHGDAPILRKSYLTPPTKTFSEHLKA